MVFFLTSTRVLTVLIYFLIDIAMALENNSDRIYRFANFTVSELDENIYLLNLTTPFSRHNLASFLLYYSLPMSAIHEFLL